MKKQYFKCVSNNGTLEGKLEINKVYTGYEDEHDQVTLDNYPDIKINEGISHIKSGSASPDPSGIGYRNHTGFIEVTEDDFIEQEIVEKAKIRYPIGTKFTLVHKDEIRTVKSHDFKIVKNVRIYVSFETIEEEGKDPKHKYGAFCIIEKDWSSVEWSGIVKKEEKKMDLSDKFLKYSPIQKTKEHQYTILELIYPKENKFCFLDEETYLFKYNISKPGGSTLEQCLKSDWEIYKVRNDETGVVFTIGDKVRHQSAPEDNGIITSIELKTLHVSNPYLLIRFEGTRGGQPNYKYNNTYTVLINESTEDKPLTKEQLIASAKIRFPIGTKLSNKNLGKDCFFTMGDEFKESEGNGLIVSSKYGGWYTVYLDGKWAEINSEVISEPESKPEPMVSFELEEFKEEQPEVRTVDEILTAIENSKIYTNWMLRKTLDYDMLKKYLKL